MLPLALGLNRGRAQLGCWPGRLFSSIGPFHGARLGFLTAS